MFLSGSSDLLAPCDRPCVAHSRSRWARPARPRALGVVLLEALPRRRSARGSRSSRYACQPPPKRGRPVGELVELDDVGDGAGEERAVVADEHDGAPGTPPIHRSRRSRPSRSRSFVGSSSRNTSKRASSSAASPARAASPPDSDAVGWSSRRAARPRSAHTSPTRASRSAPPRASQRSRAVGVAVVGAGVAGGERGGGGVELGVRRGDAGAAGEELARPSRRRPRRLLRAGSRRWPSAGCARRGPGRAAISPASTCSSVDLPTPFGPTSPIRSPAATVRSTESSTTWGPPRHRQAAGTEGGGGGHAHQSGGEDTSRRAARGCQR